MLLLHNAGAILESEPGQHARGPGCLPRRSIRHHPLLQILPMHSWFLLFASVKSLGVLGQMHSWKSRDARGSLLGSGSPDRKVFGLPAVTVILVSQRHETITETPLIYVSQNRDTC